VIVVADTSPINYLLLIGHVDILSALYKRVLIPIEVRNELTSAGSPQSVRSWANALPDWCEVRVGTLPVDPELNELDAGERDAIQLALEFGVDIVLMDETEGRRAARRRNLRVTGTLGVLEAAARRGWIDLRDVIGQLEKTNFRISANLRDEFLNRNQ